jgi:hypothetical protein
MRLLNTRTLELHEFHSDIPRYAILSHTWEDGEVTFEEIGNPDAQRKAGYQKIKRCCVQAASDDFQFVWIDTCCINKQSSAELSESINSMFRWYKNAEVCYAYLADVTGAEDPNRSESDFVKSRWFTRGWTLQELVAPSKIIFFGGIDWVKIGTKVSLQNALSRITKIDISVLEFSQNMFNASVAQRMSWASKRHTTRTEDIAYCLLGIFNINMPLLYGEGDKAFIRLQLELLNASNEQTIFAWSMPEYNEVFETGTPVSGQYTRVDVSSLGGLGLLAPSPAPFVECGNVRRYRKTTTPSHQMTNIGLSITLPTFRVPKLRMRGLHLASLDCYRENTRDWHTTPICIYLRHNGNSKFSRVALSESLLNDERWIWARKTPMFVTSERYFGHGLQKTGSSSGDMSIGTLFQDELAAGNDTTALLGDRHERHHRVCFQRLLEGIRFWMGWCIFALRNIKVVLFNSYVNVFVLLVPLGIAAGAMHWDPTAVFVLNCLAIVGLDSMLNFTMSDLWMILGQPPGDSADVVQFIVSVVRSLRWLWY